MEQEIRNDELFNQTCFTKVIKEKDSEGNELPPEIDQDGEYVAECHPEAAFRSVIDLFQIVTGRNASFIETYSEEEVKAVLKAAINEDQLWRAYSTLFDRRVSKDNNVVTFIRSQLTLAGPIRTLRGSSTQPDGSVLNYWNRYKDMTDEKNLQDIFIKSFQRKIRDAYEREN